MKTESLNVVQLHSSDYGGGAETVARLNQRGLSGLGHRCHFWVARKVGTDADIQQIQSSKGVPGLKRVVNLIEANSGLQYLYSPAFREISHWLPSESDVVHIHSLHGGGGWADLKGCQHLADRFPVIFSLHDGWLMTGHCLHGVECERWKTGCGHCPDLIQYPAIPKDGTHWNWKRKRRLFKQNEFHLIAPSNWVKNQARQSPILQNASIDVVANPIDTAVFHPGDRHSARLRLGIPEDRRTVLIAANNVNALKGSEIAKEVINALQPSGVLAMVVGLGSEKFATMLNVPSIALGYVSDAEKLADIYRASDVLMMPSRVETFGLVAVEAVACGAAVVAFHAGGLQEVAESLSQVSIKDGDATGLARAVQRALDDHNERRERVSLGQKFLQNNYTPTVHSQGCVHVYQKAMEAFHGRNGKRTSCG